MHLLRRGACHGSPQYTCEWSDTCIAVIACFLQGAVITFSCRRLWVVLVRSSNHIEHSGGHIWPTHERTEGKSVTACLLLWVTLCGKLKFFYPIYFQSKYTKPITHYERSSKLNARIYKWVNQYEFYQHTIYLSLLCDSARISKLYSSCCWPD